MNHAPFRRDLRTIATSRLLQMAVDLNALCEELVDAADILVLTPSHADSQIVRELIARRLADEIDARIPARA